MFVSMELSSYIKDLLYRYECVILPGFGAFLTQYQSAKIENDRIFHPPSKTLSFNRQLQANDGILANYVASNLGCSYELALQKIRTYTAGMSLSLAEDNTVTFQGIGDFSLNKERKIQFAPSGKENFNPASFGLTSFDAPAIDRGIVSEDKLVALHREKQRTSIPWARYAAVGLIAIALGGFTGMKIYENSVEEFNMAERNKANLLLEDQIQEATFVVENPLPIFNLSVPEYSGKYHVVAGAFRFEANAQKKVRLLVEEGFPARILGVNKYGLHQVVYQSYPTQEAAYRALREIQATNNAQAWLLVQEVAQ
ncbi:MAG TPA: SPOR domain-containing protein [Flavobacteriaceae bacterium]|nr:SPOR domain-containing protein [Flavobacteriaceae bacterium]HRW44368.1 SPOR domain-containing protein [Flavobacteriaceae bacterium]